MKLEVRNFCWVREAGCFLTTTDTRYLHEGHKENTVKSFEEVTDYRVLEAGVIMKMSDDEPHSLIAFFKDI